MTFIFHKPRRAKLNEKQVLDIRSRADAGQSMNALAEEYKVTVSCVNRIKLRTSWTFLRREIEKPANT